MSINLSGVAVPSKKQGKKNIGFGLNKRKKNVFDDEDDDDHDGDTVEKEDSAKSRREAVNREIAAEQAALRKRALRAMEKDSSGAAVYDYDAAYDSFQPQKEEKEPNKGDEGPQKSRYVEDMLMQSKRRAIERDIVYERKVAKEQDEESGQADFEGKDKFVTKGTWKRVIDVESYCSPG
jgi:Coiled-coil domain-containing protein 55 (DUF2040)